MKQFFLTILTTVLFVSVSAAEDRSTPEKTVQGFVNAFNTWSYPEVLHYVQGAKESPMLAKAHEIYKLSPNLALSDLQVHTTGDQSQVSCVVLQDGKKLRLAPFTTKLVKNPNGWVIIPAKPNSGANAEQVDDALGAVAWAIAHSNDSVPGSFATSCL